MQKNGLFMMVFALFLSIIIKTDFSDHLLTLFFMKFDATTSLYYKTIGLARENESPENPGALEKRVALIPADVKKLTVAGCSVSVEEGAGTGVGFSDEEYRAAGAAIQTTQEVYADKDLIIKFKGPAMEHIPLMRKGCTLFCMAHFHSFPERAKLLEEHQITVIAMEHIVEAPARQDDDEILGRMAANACMEPAIRFGVQQKRTVAVLGYSERLKGMIRRFANLSPAGLALYQPTGAGYELAEEAGSDLIVSDTDSFPELQAVFEKQTALLGSSSDPSTARLFDLRRFREERGEQAIAYYKSIHKPLEQGLRRIQCLHETGRAGAGYGLKLLQEESPLARKARDATVSVLGYGNVGMGAIDECCRSGARVVHILGRAHTQKPAIERWLGISDVVINGAEQPPHLRGKNFLVTNRHTQEVMRSGSVLIDLIGGSATNRSPVEPVVECTYLTDPHFEYNNMYVSALWGWPMMGMMRETAVRYSGQIAEVLLGHEEHLIGGLGREEELHPGLKPAVVCGPF